MPFHEFAFGQAPRVLAHAEYAIIEARDGNVSVTFQRVALDRAELRRATAATNHPLRAGLLANYA